MIGNKHYDKAQAHLEAVAVAQGHLDELLEAVAVAQGHLDELLDRREKTYGAALASEIRRLEAAIRNGMRLAQVEATLAEVVELRGARVASEAPQVVRL